MPFTTIAKLDLNVGEGGPPEVGFKEEDISIILNQPNVMAVRILRARTKAGQKECMVMVGVTGYELVNGVSTPTLLLDSPEDLAAVGCPPFNRRGGEFLDNP